MDTIHKSEQSERFANREQTVRIVRFRFGVVLTDGICMNQYCAPQQKKSGQNGENPLDKRGQLYYKHSNTVCWLEIYERRTHRGKTFCSFHDDADVHA